MPIKFLWNKTLTFFKEKTRELLTLNNSAHEIALGVAIGAFICIIPLYGLHTLMVVIAVLFIPRVNKIAVLIGTNVSLPPTLPFITWIGYNIGRFVLGNEYPVFNLSDFKQLNLSKFADFYYPLFIGSVIEGLICGIILYFIVLSVIILKRKGRLNQEARYKNQS